MILFHPYEEFIELQLSNRVNADGFWGLFIDDHHSESIHLTVWSLKPFDYLEFYNLLPMGT